MRKRIGLRLVLGFACLGLVWLDPRTAAAQFSGLASGGSQQPLSRDQPVAFTADSFEYDRQNAIVTATGHVEAWQGDHVLRADKVTFDRNTNVAAASGHVVLVQPDGQVLFSDYAELTQGMRDGVLKGMRAILAENGKLAANGARRIEGKVNELTHAVYTTCDLCKTDPSKPPLWQLRALTATQDVENKRIEYRDVTLDLFGQPILYSPYFAHADPSVRRESGFLVPSFGTAPHISAFLETPYYWAINDQSDVVLAPMVTTQQGPQISADYRLRLNNGSIHTFVAGAYDEGAPQGLVFAKGDFTYDDTWRYGYNINLASTANYLRDFRIQNYSSVLTTSAYVEGFGVGSYSKLDAIGYQGIATTVSQAKLPYVLPRYEYSFFTEPDALGGRTTLDVAAFDVLRAKGTNTQRAGATLEWQRPFTGVYGEQYRITLRGNGVAYNASEINQQPTYGGVGNVQGAHGQGTAAVDVKWPLIRSDASTGTQLIEPIVQLIAAPNAGSWLNRNIPNEDSLDFEFTDSTLFSLNRFSGIDRFEGGLRANVGVHGNWAVGGASIDTLIGQSYREHLDKSVPLGLGLDHRVSDVVARTTITPSSLFDLTARTRVDPRNGNINFAEGIASAGTPLLRLGAGYLYSNVNPYYLFDQSTNPTTTPPNGYPASYFVPRDEVLVSATTQFGAYKFAGNVRRNLATGRLDSVGRSGHIRRRVLHLRRQRQSALSFDQRRLRRDHSPVPDHAQDHRPVRLPCIGGGSQACSASTLRFAVAPLCYSRRCGRPRHRLRPPPPPGRRRTR